MGHEVFISYSTKDKAAADAVCAALETNGIRCWIAPRNIKPGEKWGRAILRGIAESRMMVLVFSEHANASEHIQREVERAVHRGIPIAPLRIRDVMPKDDLEYFLSSSHWVDALTPPLETHLRFFAQTVRGLLDVDGVSPGPAPDLSVTVPAPEAMPAPAPALAAAPEATPAPAPARVPPARRNRAPMLIAMALLLLAGITAGWIFRVKQNSELYKAKDFINSINMRFTRIEPGDFPMGSPNGEVGRLAESEKQHSVKLTKPFFMGTYLVTRGQFAAFVEDAPAPYITDAERKGLARAYDGTKFQDVKGASWRTPGFDQTDDHPVVEVSWNDAQAFCQWLSKKEGKSYCLPTEAQWEYACRAGTHSAYFWGDAPEGGHGFANCADLKEKEKFNQDSVFNWNDGFVFTSPVGSFKPNPWGLYDMIGNAFEWCSDCFGPYPDGDAVDPTGLPYGKAAYHVIRGGSWSDCPPTCRSAYRNGNPPDIQHDIIGFRVCLNVP